MVRFSCIRRLKYEVCRLMQSDGNSSQESYQPSKLVEKKKNPHTQTRAHGPKHQLHIHFCAFLYSKFYLYYIPLLLVLLISNETEQSTYL